MHANLPMLVDRIFGPSDGQSVKVVATESGLANDNHARTLQSLDSHIILPLLGNL